MVLAKKITIIMEDSEYNELELCKEQDIYLLDRLAEQLFGIKDLHLKVDLIRNLLENKINE